MNRRIRTTPMNDFAYLFDQMDRMAQEMLTGNAQSRYATLPVDVYDRGDEVVVQAFVPGVPAEHLDVQIDDGVLTIAGSFPELYSQEDAEDWAWYTKELRSGHFQRSINLPFKVDLDATSADVADGILRLALPKATEAKPRKIAITGASTSETPQLSGNGSQS